MRIVMTAAQQTPAERKIAARAMYEATAELAAQARAAGDYERHKELTEIARKFATETDQ